MSKVFTANVYITKSRAAIDKIFFGASQLTSLHERTMLLSEEELAQSFLYSPNKNDGLLRFEWVFGGAKKTSVNCTFVETSQLLELLLMGNDPMADVLRAKLNSLEDSGGSKAKDEFIKSINDKDAAFGNKEDRTVDDITKDIKSTSKFYFAFGVGEDLSKWSGPHVMHLHRAVLTNDENNVRKVEAQWVPTPGGHKIWSSKFVEELGFGGAVDSFNQIASRDSFVQMYASNSVYLEDEDYKSPNLNKRLRDLVGDWIRGSTANQNVVIAFPNDIPKVTQGFTDVRGKGRITKGGGQVQGSITRVNKLEELLLKFGIDTLKIWHPGIDKGFTGKKVLEDRPALAAYSQSLAVSGSKSPKLTYTDKSLSLLRTKVISADTKGEQTSKSNSHAGFNLQMGLYLEVGSNVPVTSVEGKYPILSPLYKFVDGLREVLPDSVEDFTFFEETDMRILKLWKKYGLISDSSKPAFVFGDKVEIKNMLYLDAAYTQGITSDYLFEDGFGWADPLFTSSKPTNYKKYIEEFRDLLLTDAHIRGSSFEEDVFAVDEGLDSLIGPTKSNLMDGTDLVFRHNMSNPNVRELSYSFDNYYGTLKGLDIHPDISKNFINSTSRPLLKELVFSILDKEIVGSIISQVEKLPLVDGDEAFKLALASDVISDQLSDFAANKLADDPTSKIGELRLVDLIGYILYIRNLDREAKGEGVRVVTKPERHAAAYLATYNDLKQKMVNIDLKTLPVFSKTFYMNKSVSLVGFSNSPMGINSRRGLAPYTGKYKIVQHSHVIEQGDIYSTFKLIRQGANNQLEGSNDKLKTSVIGNLDKRIAAIGEKHAKHLSEISGLPTRIEIDNGKDIRADLDRLKELRARFN